MLKTHFFSQKLSFFDLQAFLNEKIPFGRIYIKTFAFTGKNHFDVVKIDQNLVTVVLILNTSFPFGHPKTFPVSIASKTKKFEFCLI